METPTLSRAKRRAPVQLPFRSVGDARSHPQLVGERLLRQWNTLFIRLNQWVKTALPDTLNPFAQMGAVANTTFVIALISGILLLFWYSPSIHYAYDSLESMRTSSFLGQLMRSLHRYSSDACILFMVLHAFQVLFAGKFSGPRWLAWVSGVVLAGLLWVDGWLGYWLVWDQRAQLVALGSARMLDVLPFFADPLSRSFLTNESVNSLLFFLVFFMHMLIPLGIGIALWIHIMRLNRSVFFTRAKLTWAILISLTILSVIYPATSAPRADMLTVPDKLTIDWFYLFPLFLTDRLEGGMLWMITLVLTVLVTAVPWLLQRRKSPVARVLESRCNGCTQCYQDCPYNAITMMPRADREEPYASVDPARCVGCGICVGSCDPAGVTYPLLEPLDIRQWINQVLEASSPGQTPPYLAFICAESAGADLQLNAAGESPELPGYRILPVPCAGWVHPLLIERAVRKGAAGVLIVSCDLDPYCRKGVEWTAERLDGERKPALRKEKVGDTPVYHLRVDRTEKDAFLKAARQFQQEGRIPQRSPRSRFYRWTVAAVLVLGLSLATVVPSDAWYPTVVPEHPEVVVSFKHPGQLVEQSAATQKSNDELLPHMRGAASIQRVRVPVRMRIFVDGKEVLNKSYRPGGLFNDGTSLAIEKLPIPEGRHRVRIEIGDSPDPDEWNYVDEREVVLDSNTRRHVVMFDRVSGFRWY
ncbi:MAG: hydrogenase iron-sulfur subunit [Calditrichaeota bacterium]|nr:hydrogenase iron-sulfur subunit [Calditrichota bacterium]